MGTTAQPRPVTVLGELLRLVTADLTAAGRGFALVGGVAVSARTEPRFTRDVDVAVAVADDADAEAVVRSLGTAFRPLSYLEHEALGRLAAVRMGSVLAGDEHTQPVVDLQFAVSGIEPEVVAAAEPLEVLPGVVVPLARVGHLIALKLLTISDRRRIDEQDLVNLMAVASTADLDLARGAVELITARGANRDRDLDALLADAIARSDHR